MTAIVLIARLLLAAVFAVAGATKLADRRGTREGIVEFGAPEAAAGALAVLVPVLELAVAVILLPAQTAVWGAIGALALLAVFSAAIAWNLARGRAPDCHCFGQLHSAPASWSTLARNGVLALAAVVALVGSIAEPDASAVAWIGSLDGAEVVALAVGVGAAILLTVGAFAFLTLMRSYGRLLVRLDRIESVLAEAGYELDEEAAMPEIGLEPGSPAPGFSLPSTTGMTVSLTELLASELPTLLVFTSPHCGPCAALLPAVAMWQHELADEITVALVGHGAAHEVQAEATEHDLEHVLVDEAGGTHAAYEANGTPSAVLVAADGTIASWVATGTDWIERLVTTATLAPREEGLSIGTEVPALELPDLDDTRVPLESLRGHSSLLLFWNPDCGFCRAMHDDLLAWESSANGEGPQLVVVSSGDAESTAAEGFASRVLLDDEFAAGTAFGAGGTPMAVLLDADGRVASGVVAGADAVLALVRAESA